MVIYLFDIHVMFLTILLSTLPPENPFEKADTMSTPCKVSLALLSLFAAASFSSFTAKGANKTKQPSSNMVSQLDRFLHNDHAYYNLNK